jgi:membrane-bound lytic murein transglycosylase D
MIKVKRNNAKMKMPQKMGPKCFWLGLLGILVCNLLGFTTSSLAQNSLERFEKLGVKLDDWSESQIRFWRRVYLEIGSDEAFIHDSANLAYVYAITEAKTSVIEKAKKETRENLLKIYELNSGRKNIDASRLSAAERFLFELLGANEDPRAYQFAADPDRIRAQFGLKNQLESGFSISKRYLPRMEEMFLEEGVPPELTRLAFVESGFVAQAKSKVGALGIWQFMPKTAAAELRVTAAIDERMDPLKSTRAAARYLRQNFKTFQSWPLSIMAYHHGPALVQKAMKKLRSRDPIVISKTFKDSQFQFASRNYLFEFLAMLDVNAMRELFFKEDPTLSRLPEFITVSFPRPVTLKKVLQHYRLAESDVKLLNPHFLDPLWGGQSKIPAHYPIRLPGITLEDFRKLEYSGS